MLFTIISVIGVMIIGVILGRYMDIDRKTSYLISSGTAICGGSAIAAVGGSAQSQRERNGSVAGRDFHTQCDSLIHFPAYGSFLRTLASPVRHLAAIAIHDTSSVVGAGAEYGAEACDLATLIKCTRALWIIPLAFFTMWYFRNDKSGEGKAKVSIPWFILLFVVAMVIFTYTPESAMTVMGPVYNAIVVIAKRLL